MVGGARRTECFSLNSHFTSPITLNLMIIRDDTMEKGMYKGKEAVIFSIEEFTELQKTILEQNKKIKELAKVTGVKL